MGVPIYAFSKLTARSEYFRLGEEERGAAWWEVVRSIGKNDAPNAESIVGCRGVVDAPCFLMVHRYPDMDTYINYMRIWRSKTHIQKYFDSRVDLGCLDEDLNKAFGPTKAEKPTW